MMSTGDLKLILLRRSITLTEGASKSRKHEPGKTPLMLMACRESPRHLGHCDFVSVELPSPACHFHCLVDPNGPLAYATS